MWAVTLPPEPKVGSRSPGSVADADMTSGKKVASAVATVRIRFTPASFANTRTTVRVAAVRSPNPYGSLKRQLALDAHIGAQSLEPAGAQGREQLLPELERFVEAVDDLASCFARAREDLGF